MAVDLTTGTYDEEGIFSKHSDDPKSTEKNAPGDNFCTLKNFRCSKIIKECEQQKLVVVEGRFLGDDKPAIVILEKMPFDVRDLHRIFSSECRLEMKFRNNIYANYHVYFHNGFNGLHVKVIHPAQEEDFAKFIDEPMVMVKETADLYKTLVLPYLKTAFQQENEDVISSRKENIIYTDGATKTGFTLLKEDIENCSCSSKHVKAVCVMHDKSLLSMRDLTVENIPLLLKAQEKCLEVLCNKFGISASQLETYICYPPTYPSHIYFESLEKDSAIPSENAHHLETIISNLNLVPDYYQKVTLTYSLSKNNTLAKKLREVAGDKICING